MMEAVKRVSNHPELAHLNDEELAGYEFIKLVGTVTRKQYQNKLKIDSDKKAERHLRKMVDLKLVARVGSAHSIRYEIIST